MKFIDFEKLAALFLKYWDKFLIDGVSYTLALAAITVAFGAVFASVLALMKMSKIPPLRWLSTIYIEIIRGTPMMVQAMVIFWGFALINNGATLDVTVSGLIIVSINTGAYMAEIVRGGIISIDKGQFEGAQAIGMTHSQTMWNVVLPQVLRNIMPSVANEFVINVKDTSVLNVIGFTELYFYATKIQSATYAIFETYLVVAAIYFILTFTITRILRLVEKKMDGKKDYQIMGSQNMDAESMLREKKALGGNEQ